MKQRPPTGLLGCGAKSLSGKAKQVSMPHYFRGLLGAFTSGGVGPQRTVSRAYEAYPTARFTRSLGTSRGDGSRGPRQAES